MAEHKMKSKALVWHFDETSELGEKNSIFRLKFLSLCSSKKGPNIKVQYVIVVKVQIFQLNWRNLLSFVKLGLYVQ